MVVLICNLQFAICNLFAAFEDAGAGARPVSIGAYTPVADDANAIFYNPAGLSTISHPELSSCYGMPFVGLNGPDESSLSDSSFAFLYPAHFGTLGFGWLNFGLAGYYSENTFLLSYGNNVYKKLSGGVNLKYLNRKYGSDIYTPYYEVFKNGYSKNSFSSDISFLYTCTNLNFAFVIKDVNRPDVGLQSKDVVPSSFKLGSAYKTDDLKLGLETFYKDKQYGLSIGGEKLFGALAVRSSFELGSDELRNLNIGFGYNLASRFLIDYAFTYPFSEIKGTYGSHRLSFGLKFGPPPKDEISEAKKEIENLNDEISRIEDSLKKIQEENLKLKEIRESHKEVPKETPQKEKKIEIEIDKKKIMKDHYDNGLSYYQKGEYKNAIKEFEEILKIEPGHQQSQRLINQSKLKIEEISAELYYKGLKEYTKGNVKSAISYWQRAVDANPDDEKIKNALEKAKTELK